MNIRFYTTQPAIRSTSSNSPRFWGKTHPVDLLISSNITSYGLAEQGLKKALGTFQKVRATGIQKVQVKNDLLGKKIIITMGDGYDYSFIPRSDTTKAIDLERIVNNGIVCGKSLGIHYTHSPSKAKLGHEYITFYGQARNTEFDTFLQEVTFKPGSYPYPDLLSDVEAFITDFKNDLKTAMQKQGLPTEDLVLNA